MPHGATDPAQPFNVNAVPEALRDMDREAVARVRKGGIVLWQGAMLHASRGNPSDRWRRAYAVHFVAEGAQYKARAEAPVGEDANPFEHPELPQAPFVAALRGEAGLAQGMAGPIEAELRDRELAELARQAKL